jgi:hypothetical protein
MRATVRQVGKWLTVLFVVSLFCAVLYPVVTPSIYVHSLW